MQSSQKVGIIIGPLPWKDEGEIRKTPTATQPEDVGKGETRNRIDGAGGDRVQGNLKTGRRKRR
jgi:hypothetical protein